MKPSDRYGLTIRAIILIVCKERKIALTPKTFYWYCKWLGTKTSHLEVAGELRAMVREGLLEEVKADGQTFYGKLK